MKRDKNSQDISDARRPVQLVAIKDLMWLVYLYPLRLASRILPPGSFVNLGSLALPIFSLLTAKQRKAVKKGMENLFRSLGDERDADIFSMRYMRNALIRSLEDLVLDRLVSREQLECREFLGREYLDSALAEGKGIILISVHTFGNRLGKRYLSLSGYPVMSIRNREPIGGSMGRLGRSFLQPSYIKFLESVIVDEAYLQDPDCSLKILRRLREGGMVNFHLDGVAGRKSKTVSFLRGTGVFPVGFLEIARITGAPLLPMFCSGDRKILHIEFDQPFRLQPADSREEFIDANLEQVVRRMEDYICANPDQWELWVRL